MMSCYNISPHVEEWIDIVKNGDIRCCEEQHLLVDYVIKCFQMEDIYVDEEQAERYLSLQKYFPWDLFPWEKFVLVLHDCTYWKDTGMPRWPDLFCLLGRGAGKDGMIAYESMCLTSPYNPVKEYDVDICANNEDQATRPVKDLIAVFESPKFTKKLRRFFSWTKELIVGKKNRAEIKGRTHNPKGKDGLRSGIVIFNEVHQYLNYADIDVFTTGLGKKQHPRRSYYTTDGDVREGPLDDLLETSEGILRNGDPDNGMLPFICKLNCANDVYDEENWPMANPSLPYLPNLLAEIRKEFHEWKKSPFRLPAFMIKRMNIHDVQKEGGVTEWANIIATDRQIPDLSGMSCTVGIDYMKVTDLASVNFHFRDGDTRYDINHSWLCSHSKDIPRLKCPWKEWEANGLLTVVDDVEIHPDIIAEYIQGLGRRYDIRKLAIDTYRYALLKRALEGIGFTAKEKKIKLITQRDIIQVVPVIDSCFVNHNFVWGDNPVLRWGCNNTKLISYGRKEGADKGSFVYAKIESKSRKTDPWMSLVMSMCVESELDSAVKAPLYSLPVITI